jgi:hypothetical protein
VGRDRAKIAPGRASPGVGALLGGERPVVLATAIEREFSTDCVGRPPEALRDRVLRGTPAHGIFLFDAIGEREVRVSHRTALGRRGKFGNAQGPRPAGLGARRGPWAFSVELICMSPFRFILDLTMRRMMHLSSCLNLHS